MVHFSGPCVCGARADEGWLCPSRHNSEARQGPGLSYARPRPGECCLSFNQLPCEALRSCGSCKVTADPATFCNWDHVPSWCLDRRLWGTQGLPRPGLSSPQEDRRPRPPPLTGRKPRPRPHLQPMWAERRRSWEPPVLPHARQSFLFQRPPLHTGHTDQLESGRPAGLFLLCHFLAGGKSQAFLSLSVYVCKTGIFSSPGQRGCEE